MVAQVVVLLAVLALTEARVLARVDSFVAQLELQASLPHIARAIDLRPTMCMADLMYLLEARMPDADLREWLTVRASDTRGRKVML